MAFEMDGISRAKRSDFYGSENNESNIYGINETCLEIDAKSQNFIDFTREYIHITSRKRKKNRRVGVKAHILLTVLNRPP